MKQKGIIKKERIIEEELKSNENAIKIKMVK